MQPRSGSMRTSDAERQKAADFLRDACGDGRLSTHELEERLDALFAGTTVADIAVLVRDLPGGRAVIPRHDGRIPRRVPAAAPVPVRRRGLARATPVAVVLAAVAGAGLVFAALPPLLAVLFAAVALSAAIAVGIMAVALAPVGLALFGLAWLANRVFRGGHHGPRGWAGPGRGRHPFL